MKGANRQRPSVSRALNHCCLEHTTFDVHCLTHPVAEDRCADHSNCSIRPVWMMLQRRIDDALESVHLADLLQDEPVVRSRVGLPVLQA